MTIFINAEYVIAKLFIEQTKFHRHKITLTEISSYSIKLQSKANDQNLDVVFLSTADQIKKALRDFSDYFTYERKTNEVYLTYNKDISDIEYHFIAYLPTQIAQLEVLQSS